MQTSCTQHDSLQPRNSAIMPHRTHFVCLCADSASSCCRRARDCEAAAGDHHHDDDDATAACTVPRPCLYLRDPVSFSWEHARLTAIDSKQASKQASRLAHRRTRDRDASRTQTRDRRSMLSLPAAPQSVCEQTVLHSPFYGHRVGCKVVATEHGQYGSGAEPSGSAATNCLCTVADSSPSAAATTTSSAATTTALTASCSRSRSRR